MLGGKVVHAEVFGDRRADEVERGGVELDLWDQRWAEISETLRGREVGVDGLAVDNLGCFIPCNSEIVMDAPPKDQSDEGASQWRGTMPATQ